MNKLVGEKSPYLLQHAANPVHWYPWGEEAFAQAQSSDKPIFLSIGYSTCHWCHVMAHESFADETVAALLNAHFIAIKVDREERPDVDAVYMSVCQSLTASGGWPLTIIMTPEQKPFFAGTYLPKNSGYGVIGLIPLLENIRDQWQNDRAKLAAQGESITAALQAAWQEQSTPGEPSPAFLSEALAIYKRRFDKRWGGFGHAPKFPAAQHLLFLLRYGHAQKDDTVMSMALLTLQQMYRGGIFDHIGGGFSRYATDNRWLTPHFEKMLYDNALLADAYLAAWQLTGVPLYRSAACRTLDYVLRELTNDEGAFFCAQDADSEGVEGKYYLLSPDEVTQQLGEHTGRLYNHWYGISDDGNFAGLNIPNLLDNPDFAAEPPWRAPAAAQLCAYRRQRMALHCDDKVLTGWNSLMIAALANAGYRLDHAAYLLAAQKAQSFIAAHLCTQDGRLFLRWRDHDARYAGQLEDYAGYALALLALYAATGEVDYLRQAIRTAHHLLDLFSDAEAGGFYLYAWDSEQLIGRPKEIYDSAMPSGNASAALLLQRLAQLTGEEFWRTQADAQLRFLTGALQDYPAGSGYALLALWEALAPAGRLVCATSGRTLSPAAREILRRHDKPLAVLVKTQDNAAALAELAPFTASCPIPAAGETYYLCRHGACTAPTQSPEQLREMLAQG